MKKYFRPIIKIIKLCKNYEHWDLFYWKEYLYWNFVELYEIFIDFLSIFQKTIYKFNPKHMSYQK
jgi:hypothetical protein